MVLKVIYTQPYIVLQVVPKELLLIQTMNATVDNVPKYQVIAYKIPVTLSEPYFEDSKVVGPETVMPPISPDRCSLTSLVKCIVSLYFLIISVYSLIGFISTKLDIYLCFIKIRTYNKRTTFLQRVGFCVGGS